MRTIQGKTYWTLANLLSLGNVSCGVLSLLESFSKSFEQAGFFLFAAVVFDFLDGKAARSFGQVSRFGKGLDSLSDFLSFGVAPAFLSSALLSDRSWHTAAVLLFFIIAGAWRLAYFFQWPEEYRSPGIPITFNGFIFPALYFLHASSVLFLGAYLFAALFMVLPILLHSSTVS